MFSYSSPAALSPTAQSAANLFRQAYGPPPSSFRVDRVPGRVNLIGEHIDYHSLPVLPMAIDRQIAVAYAPAKAAELRTVSAAIGGSPDTIHLGSQTPGPPGDWLNYVRAAVEAAGRRWRLRHGISAAIASDLPLAAGLSSSSALMIAHLLALLRANDIEPSIDELMDILPETEHFVGTRGGGMDHAAIVASSPGAALHVRFAPFSFEPVPLPEDWRFLVAHSGMHAEKSGAMRDAYNRVKQAGLAGLRASGLTSFTEARANGAAPPDLREKYPAFAHVVEEAARVDQAIVAMGQGDLAAFGQILLASHRSLRDRLAISTPAVDRLVDDAVACGADGARMTGAGFGGCVLAVCRNTDCHEIRQALKGRYYARQTGLNVSEHLFFVQASGGACIQPSRGATSIDA